MEQEKTIDELKANPKNPRLINKHDFESLKRAIIEFGDLSGVVFNVRSQQLVGGHQRVQSFKAMSGEKHIKITHRYEQPTAVGTIAIGHIDFNGEKYTYREVDWAADRELAANIAANRIQGQFDLDLLAQVTFELQQLNPDIMDLTGQTNSEVERLLQMSSQPEQPPAEEPAARCESCGQAIK